MANIKHTCEDCGLSSSDLKLVERHSCDVTANGGQCEDYPCCGHESGDCNGLLYGSDEAIKASVYAAIASGHGLCEHSEGLYLCDDMGYDEGDDL